MNYNEESNQIESYEVSLADLFCSENKRIRVDKIKIPMIQRDYAQGRPDKARLRKQFLEALFDAIDKDDSKPIVLDFVYGRQVEDEDTDEMYFEPIDGQQRLTTLFLLHLYVAKHINETLSSDALRWLKGFSYETRQSSTRFCRELINMSAVAFDDLDAYLKGQSWFSKRYRQDPTVAGMICTLNDISNHYVSKKDNSSRMESIWSRLMKNVTFMLLYLKKLNATDDLYIKMNSRGLQLTDFEKFKAELEGYFKDIEKSQEMDFGVKIDTIWTNLLWDYRDKKCDGTNVALESYDPDNISPYTQNGLDNKFHHMFRRYMSIEGCKAGLFLKKTLDGDDEVVEIMPYSDSPDSDLISLAETVFKNASPTEKTSRMLRICKFLNMLYRVSNENGACDMNLVICFFNRFMYVGDSSKESACKTRLFGGSASFGCDLLSAFASDGTINAGLTLIIEAFIEYANTDIDENTFRERLRIVRNLIANSDTRNENLSTQLKRLDEIIRHGDINVEVADFNKGQKQQELDKLQWIHADGTDPEDAKRLYRIENHDAIWGDLSAFVFAEEKENKRFSTIKNEYFPKFLKYFKDSGDSSYWHLRHRALMVIGDYARIENDLTLYAGDRKAYWRERVFSGRNSSVYPYLFKLLDSVSEDGDADTVLNDIIRQFIKECSAEGQENFPWRYYAAKYRGIQRGEERKVYKYKGCKYAIVAYNKTAGNCQRWNVFLNRIFKDPKFQGRFSLENYENRLELSKLNLRLESNDNEYRIRPMHADAPVFLLPIKKNGAGFDAIDRIQFFLSFYEELEEPFINRDMEMLADIVNHYNITPEDGKSDFSSLFKVGYENDINTSEEEQNVACSI